SGLATSAGPVSDAGLSAAHTGPLAGCEAAGDEAFGRVGCGERPAAALVDHRAGPADRERVVGIVAVAVHQRGRSAARRVLGPRARCRVLAVGACGAAGHHGASSSVSSVTGRIETRTIRAPWSR